MGLGTTKLSSGHEEGQKISHRVNKLTNQPDHLQKKDSDHYRNQGRIKCHLERINAKFKTLVRAAMKKGWDGNLYPFMPQGGHQKLGLGETENVT